MQILFADHRLQNARAMSQTLIAEGIVVDHTACGREAAGMLRIASYDAVVLAADLPGVDGVQLLRQLRQAGNGTPAVILTLDPTPAPKVEAFHAGADDVVSAVVEPEELAARLRAVVRRDRRANSAVLRIEALEINPQTQEVTWHGKPVHLTGKEYEILHLMAHRRGMTLTKDALLSHLYGGMDEPEPKIIDVFVCKLRKKLQLAGCDDLIGTVWGKGYMMRADRTELATPVQHDGEVSSRLMQRV